MESMEDESTMEACASLDQQNDNQYRADSPAPELTNEPLLNSGMNSEEHLAENAGWSTQYSTEEQVRIADSEQMAMEQSSSQVSMEKAAWNFEETPPVAHEVIVDGSAPTDLHGTTQSVTTDNTNPNQRCIDMYEYSCRFLGNLTQLVEQLKPVLIQIFTPDEDAGPLLRPPEIPFPPDFKITLQKGLETLVDILEDGADSLYLSRHMENGFPAGQQTIESAESRIAEPTEANSQPLNAQLQIPAIPKIVDDAASQALSLTTLSQLLSQAQRIVNDLNLVELKISEQPQEFWKKRYINCLENKSCTAIQGRSRKQQQYMSMTWSPAPDCNAANLFVLVQLQFYDGRPHPTKVLVPPQTTVKTPDAVGKKRKSGKVRPTLDDLIINDAYGFDKTTRSILCPVTDDEYNRKEKDLVAIMFSLCNTSDEIASAEETDAEASDDENDPSIEKELNKLCKLSISLCCRTETNDLKAVSNFLITDIIEESQGTKPLAIKASDVTPKKLCRSGNETITVPLNTASEKHGFVVRLDDEPLSASKIRGGKDKKISFPSRPSQGPSQNYLRVRVSKQSIAKTIKHSRGPYKTLAEDELLDMYIAYADVSDNPHDHPSTETNLSK